MFDDARNLPRGTTLQADICIVGGGLAGITLARELASSKLSVCLLESGGMRPDKVTQSLYWGENVGLPYYPLDTSRTRLFGGTSHCWHIGLGEGRQGVRLRELDGIDFERRDWVPYSGWPFPKALLDPYYERAHAICAIGPYTSEPEDWEDAATPSLAFMNGAVRTTIFRFADRTLFFKTYGEEIGRAENITSLLHGNAVEIETDEEARQVSSVRCRTLEGGEFRVKARQYVLALGGIETPRLMLLSDRVRKQGLGNEHDLVGRFFMEHPHLWSGIVIPASPSLVHHALLYAVHGKGGVPIMGKLALSEEIQRRKRLRNWCVSLHPAVCPEQVRNPVPGGDGVDSLKSILAAIGRGKVPKGIAGHAGRVLADIGGVTRSVAARLKQELGKENRWKRLDVFRLNHMAEQEPNPLSRVVLTTERDALGQRRVALDWRVTEQDMSSMRRSQEILDGELRRAGIGRLHIQMEGDGPPQGLHGGWHHMGTTRMDPDPRKGVVDPDCRVHGLSNLHVGGASVFPTGGCANPVLTTIALVVRLADRLKDVCAQ
jgi:choline dehydrogenase-like flavoprotein